MSMRLRLPLEIETSAQCQFMDPIDFTPFLWIMAYKLLLRRFLMTRNGRLCTISSRSFARTNTYASLAESFDTVSASRA